VSCSPASVWLTITDKINFYSDIAFTWEFWTLSAIFWLQTLESVWRGFLNKLEIVVGDFLSNILCKNSENMELINGIITKWRLANSLFIKCTFGTMWERRQIEIFNFKISKIQIKWEYLKFSISSNALPFIVLEFQFPILNFISGSRVKWHVEQRETCSRQGTCQSHSVWREFS